MNSIDLKATAEALTAEFPDLDEFHRGYRRGIRDFLEATTRAAEARPNLDGYTAGQQAMRSSSRPCRLSRGDLMTDVMPLTEAEIERWEEDCVFASLEEVAMGEIEYDDMARAVATIRDREATIERLDEMRRTAMPDGKIGDE